MFNTNKKSKDCLFLQKRLCFNYLEQVKIEPMQELEQIKKNPKEYRNKGNNDPLVWDNVNTHVWEIEHRATSDLEDKKEAAKKKIENDPRIANEKDSEKKAQFIKEEIAKLDNEFREIQTNIWKYRDEAITALNALFAQEKKELELVSKRIKDNLSEKIEPEKFAQIKQDAEVIAELGDDRNFITGIWKSGVHDYIGSEIIDSVGNKYDLSQSVVENLAMGAAMSLGRERGKAFIDGLRGREIANEALSDQGVYVRDIQMQVLKEMNFPNKTDDDKEIAKQSPAALLFADISRDSRLAPSMRGMLLGELAKIRVNVNYAAKPINEINSDINSKISPVKRMYSTLIELQMGGKSQVNTFTGREEAGLLAEWAAVGGVRGVPGGPWGVAAGVLQGLAAGAVVAIDRTASGDKESLEQAALIMLALKKGEKLREIQDELVAWEQEKVKIAESSKGKKDEEKINAQIGSIDTLIAQLQKTPELVDKQLEVLKRLIAEVKTLNASSPAMPTEKKAESVPAAAPAPNAAPAETLPKDIKLFKTLSNAPQQKTPINNPPKAVTLFARDKSSTNAKEQWLEIVASNGIKYFANLKNNDAKDVEFYIIPVQPKRRATKTASEPVTKLSAAYVSRRK